MVVYGDFNCPYSFAVNERLEALGASIEWRGHEHAPALPRPAARPSRAVAEQVSREVGEVREAAPEVRVEVPERLPSSNLALAAYAAAVHADPRAAARFRLLAFRALWQDGRDISRPEVVGALLEEAGLPAQLSAAEEVPVAWEEGFASSGLPGVPAAVREDGTRMLGIVPLAELKAYLAGEPTGDLEGAY
jgi:predicted DsbA family dithiol-disulfide isomerase